jgi:alkaline phosphatase D
VTMDRHRLAADFRTLSGVTTPDGTVATGGAFTLQDGVRGLQPA